MSGMEFSIDGHKAAGKLRCAPTSPEGLRAQQLVLIDKLLRKHEEMDFPGGREVHVLQPADRRDRFLHDWRLVNYFEAERFFMGYEQRQWLDTNRLAGWIIKEGVKIAQPDSSYYGYGVRYYTRDMLLLSDASYAVAEGPIRWAEQKEDNWVLVPGENLQPLTPTDTSLDLRHVADTLNGLLPAYARQNPGTNSHC